MSVSADFAELIAEKLDATQICYPRSVVHGRLSAGVITTHFVMIVGRTVRRRPKGKRDA